MAYKSDITAGTVSSAGNVITGVGTGFVTANIAEGDVFMANDWFVVVASVQSETQLTVDPTRGVTGAALSGANYGLRYMSDGSRVSAQTREMINLLMGSGSLEALAALDGLPDTIPMFSGPGTMVLVSKTDLTNGVNYDVQVGTLAERAAYNGEAVGFTVLVSNIGDGRAAVYSRVGAAGTWSAPAYITGPVGPNAVVEVGTTTTLPPGSAATVTPTPIPGGTSLAFGLPAGEGFLSRGAYVGSTAYVKGDVVSYNGSSYVAKIATTGNLPTNTTYWNLLAQKGADGTGTGDVSGPTSSVADRIALFNGTTGKLIKDSGLLLTSLLRSDAAQTITAANKGQIIDNIGAGGLSGFRNKIINGGFDIWQRGGGPFAGSVYGADRWKITGGTGSVNSISRAAVATHLGTYSLEWLRSTAGSTPTTLSQSIENVRTLNGKKATLTFNARASSATTMTINLIQIFGTGGSAPVGFPVGGTIALSTVMQKFSFTVDLADLAGKTIGSAADCLRLDFVRAHNSTNPTASLYLSRVSLVEGDATAEADPFAERHIGQELDLCRRYYQGLASVRARFDAHKINEENGVIVQHYPMRASPTIATTVVQNVNLSSQSLTVYPAVANCLLYTAIAATASATDSLLNYTLDAEL